MVNDFDRQYWRDIFRNTISLAASRARKRKRPNANDREAIMFDDLFNAMKDPDALNVLLDECMGWGALEAMCNPPTEKEVERIYRRYG